MRTKLDIYVFILYLSSHTYALPDIFYQKQQQLPSTFFILQFY
jgi:hypothetical protein